MTLASILRTTTTGTRSIGKNLLLLRSSQRQFSAAIMDPNEDKHEYDIEDLHLQALKEGSRTYIDPATDFTVFTEICHLKRGTCCGNACRHCPYGFENVRNGPTRAAKLRSGDRETADRMLQAIHDGAPIVSTINSSSTAPPKNPKQQRTSFGTSAVANSATTTDKNVPYTRKGDKGTSQLGTGERRSKDDLNFEALGTVDELCSVVGVVHTHLDDDVEYGNMLELLLDVMSRLFDIGSHVAKPKLSSEFNPNGLGDGFDSQHIDDLESWINSMTNDLPELTSFILPTGSKAAAHLHVARTVCRRAERRMVPLVRDHKTCDPHALKYLNRLSDFFFVAARWVNFCQGQEEIQYQRESPGMTQRQRVTRSLKNEKQEEA